MHVAICRRSGYIGVDTCSSPKPVYCKTLRNAMPEHNPALEQKIDGQVHKPEKHEG